MNFLMTSPVYRGLNSTVNYEVTCIRSSLSMGSNLRDMDIRTSIGINYFLLFSFQSEMLSFISDLIKSPNLLKHR